MTQSLTGIVVATPFHPCGTVLTEWATYVFKQGMPTQHPPGMTMAHIWRNEGEPCEVAFTQLVYHAQRTGAPFIFFVEDDLFLPSGALQALFYELTKAENADVAGIGGVYSWRDGPVGKPFPLIFPQEGLGPKCDYTVGDVLEVDAAGQGCFLMRTEALTTQPEPWFASAWRTPDNPVAHIDESGGSDMFFFRKLRGGTTPDGAPWRVLVHTGVVCEHIDRETLQFSPPDWDLEYRERYGYAKDSELLRRTRRLRAASGKVDPKGEWPSLVSEFGMTHGRAPAKNSPLFTGVSEPDRPIGLAQERAARRRVTPNRPAKPGPHNPYRVLNVGGGGCGVEPAVLEQLRLAAEGRELEVVHNEHAGSIESLQAEGIDTSTWLIDDAITLGQAPDASFDAVYASHLLEHLPITRAPEAVRNWWRVLRPNGRLIIKVPDVSTIGPHVCDGKLDVVLYRAAGLDITPRLILNGGQRYPGDFHLNTFDMRSLRNCCYEAGISERELWITPGGAYECVAIAVKGLDLVGEMVRQKIRSTTTVPSPQRNGTATATDTTPDATPAPDTKTVKA